MTGVQTCALPIYNNNNNDNNKNNNNNNCSNKSDNIDDNDEDNYDSSDQKENFSSQYQQNQTSRNKNILKEKTKSQLREEKKKKNRKSKEKMNFLKTVICENQNLDFALSHPALSIIVNYFLMPHIGSQNSDKLTIKKYCNNFFYESIDPQKDFSSLNLQNFLNYLPSVKNVLQNIFQTSDIHDRKQAEKEKKEFLPDMNSLNKINFHRLVRQLNDRINENENENGDENNQCENKMTYLIHNGKKIQKFSEEYGMDLSLLGTDVLIHVLSFLSFKRICRLSCASSSFLNASKDDSLWEILYRRKFRNLIFENYRPMNEKNDKCEEINNDLVIEEKYLQKKKQCEECYSNFSKTLQRKRKIQPCSYECESHYWLGL